jgi:hypothetical protein
LSIDKLSLVVLEKSQTISIPGKLWFLYLRLAEGLVHFIKEDDHLEVASLPWISWKIWTGTSLIRKKGLDVSLDQAISPGSN